MRKFPTHWKKLKSKKQHNFRSIRVANKSCDNDRWIVISFLARANPLIDTSTTSCRLRGFKWYFPFLAYSIESPFPLRGLSHKPIPTSAHIAHTLLGA